MPQDKVKVLYDAVSKDYDIGSEDEFRQKLANPEKQKAFYEGVGKEYALGTFDEFVSKIAPEVKKKRINYTYFKRACKNSATWLWKFGRSIKEYAADHFYIEIHIRIGKG